MHLWFLQNPAYKKGSRTIVANYRPISLTSICCKILEHVIHSFIFLHIDSNKILCYHQRGFRPNHSCETQVIAATNDFSMCLNNGGHIDALFLDFAKAFNKVPHERLCYKLSYYGINGLLLLWIKDFLSDRSQQVVLEGKYSDSCPVLFKIPPARVNSYLRSFLSSRVKLWNRLPEHLVNAPSVEHFRELLINLPQFLTTPTIIS